MLFELSCAAHENVIFATKAAFFATKRLYLQHHHNSIGYNCGKIQDIYTFHGAVAAGNRQHIVRERRPLPRPLVGELDTGR